MKLSQKQFWRWHAIETERDAHAETLRVLLLREAARHTSAAVTMRYHAGYNDTRLGDGAASVASRAMRTSMGEQRAMAGVALILALMIGGSDS